MKYAVIQTGGKQYRVKEGEVLEVELLDVASGAIVFDQVLLNVNEDKVEVGMPTLEGMKVYASVLSEVKADKVQVFKYKSKSRYRKLKGHRQQYAKIKIESIGVEPKKVVTPKAEVKTSPVKKAAPATVSARSSKSEVGKKPAVKKAAK